MLIISFSSAKGGTGKTTSCVNLAYSLSVNNTPQKVLIVDFDSQGGCTHHLSSQFKGEFRASIHDILLGQAKSNLAIHQYNKNLYLIPVNYNFYKIASTDFEKPLRKFIDEVWDEYDFLFFDLGPNVFPGTIIPLSVSNYAVIPVDCSGGLSLLGLQTAADLIMEIRESKNKTLDILGILPCFVDRTKMAKEVFKHLEKKYSTDLFPKIRRNTAIAQASSLGKTIFEHAPDSIGAQDYSVFCQDFLRRIKGR